MTFVRMYVCKYVWLTLSVGYKAFAKVSVWSPSGEALLECSWGRPTATVQFEFFFVFSVWCIAFTDQHGAKLHLEMTAKEWRVNTSFETMKAGGWALLKTHPCRKERVQCRGLWKPRSWDDKAERARETTPLLLLRSSNTRIYLAS